MNVKKFLIGFIAILGILVFCTMLYQFIIKKNITEVSTANEQKNTVINQQTITNQNKKNENTIVLNNTTEKYIIGKNPALFTEENYPRIDGSTATIPLSEAFKAEFLAKDVKDVSVEHNKTHQAYQKLINGDVDLILVTYPSEEEQQMAIDAGVELEILPVVNEAFVFFTNERNPVNSLTLEQIQKIYTGEYTNWNQVGGNNAEIKAYQRNPNSGSQSGMIKLVMGELKLMDAPEHIIVGDMSSIVGLVSNYENGENSIGYSYYYYVTTMYDTIDKEVTDRIKLLGVNGIVPNNTTIKNGTYPIRTNYYIVINKAEAENSNTRKLVNAMLDTRGQKAAEAVGYVGVK